MIKPFGFRFTAQDQTKAAFNGINQSLTGIQGASARTSDALARASATYNGMRNQLGRSEGVFVSNRRMIQQLGMQVSDFSVQLAGGQDALLAFTQQGPQMLQFFGPVGAAAAGLVSVFGALALVLSKTAGGFAQLEGVGGVLTPMFQAIGVGFTATKEALLDAANVIVNNIDRIVIAIGVASTMFLTRWVAGIGAATVATGIFSGALNVLRFALIRLPMFTVIMLATELIYQFMRLAEGAGGFGNALVLLKDLAVEVFERIIIAGGALKESIAAAAEGIRAKFLAVWADISENAFLAFSGIARAWNAVAPELGLDEIDTSGMKSYADEMGRAARDSAAMADDMSEIASFSWGEVTKPLASVQAIRDALANVKDTTIDVRDLFGEVAEAADSVAGGKKAPLKKAKEETDEWLKSIKKLADSLAGSVGDGLMAIIDGTKKGKEAFRDMARDVIKQLYDVLVIQRIVAALSNAISGGSGNTGGLLAKLPGMGRPAATATHAATGGTAWAGKPYIINENAGRGGELFIPGQNGTISNGKVGGGETIIVNQTFNLSMGVTETVRAEMAKAMPMMKQAATEAVVSARRRGGAVAQAFG